MLCLQGRWSPLQNSLVGATTIVFPSVGLPLLAGSAVFKLGRGWKRKRSDTKNGQESQQPETGSVTLCWNHVNCQITSKKGGAAPTADKTARRGQPWQASPCFRRLQAMQRHCCSLKQHAEAANAVHCACKPQPVHCIHRGSHLCKQERLVTELLPACRLLAIMGPSGEQWPALSPRGPQGQALQCSAHPAL